MSTQANTTTSGVAPERDDTTENGDAPLRLDSLSGNLESLGEAPKKRLPMQLIMLVGAVVVAGGSLVAMRKLGMGPSGVSGGEVKIDYDENAALVSADHQKVLDDLTSSHIEQQVPTEQVQRNPFKMATSLLGETETKPEAVDDGTVQSMKEKEEAARRQREIDDRRALIQSTKDSLRLHSVLSGSTPLARINNETVRVGGKVADMFTVTAIHGRSVEMTLDDQAYTISMDGEEEGGKKAPASPPQHAPAPASKSDKPTASKPGTSVPPGKK